MAGRVQSAKRQQMNSDQNDELLCAGAHDYHFFTTLMLDDFCICMTPQESEEMKTLAIAQICLCLVGVVVLLLTLVVLSALVTKSSTAVLVSILMLYNLLLLCGQGLLSSFTVIGMKDFAQRIANALWIMGTWGVRCTVLELGLDQILNVFWPTMARKRRRPLKVVKRTSLVFLMGLVVCGLAFTEAIMKTKPWDLMELPRSCDEAGYYYLYWTAYQLFLLLVVWLIPVVAQTIIFLALLVQMLKINLRAGSAGRQTTASSDDYDEQMCVLALQGCYVALNLPLSCLLLVVGVFEITFKFVYIAEMGVLVSTFVLPFTLLLWTRFTTEIGRILYSQGYCGSLRPVARIHFSLPSNM